MRYAAVALAVGIALSSGTARAGEFDPDGTFRFASGAALALDFESATLPPNANPMDPAPVRKAAGDALSGGFVLKVSPFQQVVLVVPMPKGAATYRASVWIRGGEASAFVGLMHDGKRIDELPALYPTGRITSDGWIELANDHIAVDGAVGVVTVGVFSPAGCELDAFELVADGAVVGPLVASCQGIDDGGACGTGRVCTFGACRRVNADVPPIPADREAVTNYLANRLEFLFGPYQQRAQDLPIARIAIEQMRHASDPWSYWNGFLLALRRLHDSHTGTQGGISDYGIRNPRPISACFVEGDADWSHATAPKDPAYLDVLVSNIGKTRNFGLHTGDRLVRVDGRHPIDWARSLVAVNWDYESAANHTTFAEQAASLRALITRYAASIEVIHCDAAAKSCGPIETMDILAIPPPAQGESFDPIECDNRPLRHLANSPANHYNVDFGTGEEKAFFGIVNESNATERIFGVEWDSLYTNDGQDGIGKELSLAIGALDAQSASAAILDHRRGTGGTIAGPAIVWNYAEKKHPLTFYLARQRAEDAPPTQAAGKLLFDAAVAKNDFGVDYAGGTHDAPIPLALLITSDISASDWLALGMKGQPKVRLFGPYATSGAFSTRLAFGYWLGIGYTLASGDSFVADGRAINGTGADPDEAVLPKQSDLVTGKDSVFEAALAWVRAEGGGK